MLSSSSPLYLEIPFDQPCLFIIFCKTQAVEVVVIKRRERGFRGKLVNLNKFLKNVF